MTLNSLKRFPRGHSEEIRMEGNGKEERKNASYGNPASRFTGKFTDLFQIMFQSGKGNT